MTREETNEMISRINEFKKKLIKINQELRLLQALEDVKVHHDNVKSIDFNSIGMAVGVFLINRTWENKQRRYPSDYRRFKKPVTYKRA